MSRKIHLDAFALIVFSLPFVFSGAIALAATAESLYNTANSLEEQKQFDRAMGGYQQTLVSSPNDPYGQRAKIDIDKVAIIKVIEFGNIAQAQADLQKFTDAYKTHWYFAPALYRIAERLEEGGWLDEAKNIFQQILKDYPQDQYAQRSKIDLAKVAVISNIQSGTDSQSALDELNSFSDNSYFPAILYRIAERYEDAQKYDKAKTVYGKVSQLYPDNEYGIRSQIDILKISAIAIIHSGNESQIRTIIDKLKNDFAQNPYLPAALFRIAERYEDAKKYDSAKALYSQISQQFVASSFAGWARLNIAKIDIITNISSSSDPVIRSVAELVATYDYATYPVISNAIYLIAEKCYVEGAKADINKVAGKKLVALSAALIDKYVLGKISGRDNHASVSYIRGLAYDNLGDYEKAAQAFQNVCLSNPKHQYADYCLYGAAQCYEKQLSQKTISEAKAKGTIKKLYSDLTLNYPKSHFASDASLWLKENR